MPQGIDTPGVEELPRVDETSGVPIEGDGEPGENKQGQGGYRTPPHHPSNRGAQSQRRQ